METVYMVYLLVNGTLLIIPTGLGLCTQNLLIYFLTIAFSKILTVCVCIIR